MDKIEQLQELMIKVKELSFSVVQGFQQSLIFLIFEVLMVFIVLSWGAILLPSNWFHAPCLNAIQRIFLISTKSISSIRMLSQI